MMLQFLILILLLLLILFKLIEITRHTQNRTHFFKFIQLVKTTLVASALLLTYNKKEKITTTFWGWNYTHRSDCLFFLFCFVFFFLQGWWIGWRMRSGRSVFALWYSQLTLWSVVRVGGRWVSINVSISKTECMSVNEREKGLAGKLERVEVVKVSLNTWGQSSKVTTDEGQRWFGTDGYQQEWKEKFKGW